MNRKIKYSISGILVLLMLLTICPAGVMAAADETGVSLEQAIQTVKEHFTIPTSYTEFSSGYQSSEEEQAWSLQWIAPGDSNGRFSAEVDARTGIVLSMNSWQESEPETKFPTVSLEEARDIGEQLLKELLPDRYDQLQEIFDDQVIALGNWESGEYNLRWQRTANGIPVDNEGVRIDVDYTSGQVNYYRLTWSDYELPDASGVISKQQADSVFMSNEMLELQYLINSSYKKSDLKLPQVKLVYRINHSSDAVIDALTGKPMDLQKIAYLYDQAANGMGATDESVAKEVALTPQEQQEVERNLNLISQVEAIAAVEQWFEVSSGMELTQAELRQDYSNPEMRTWSLSWQANSDNTGAPTYMSARVNAASGELISFYQYSQESEAKADLTRDRAQQIADRFLKQIQPKLSQELRLNPESSENPTLFAVEENRVPDQWHFHYERLVNGIPCPADGIDIEVDSRTDMINSYNLNWTEIDFPPADEVMGMDKACEVFLTRQPMTLSYTKDYSDNNCKFRLIYSPQSRISEMQSDMIDAVTGESLGWDGTPLTPDTKPTVFTDIKGHFAEEEISLLGQAGIMCEYGTAFHPQEEINLVTFLRAMLKVNNTYYRADEASDEEIMKQARDNKWLQEDIEADTILTRDMLAKLMVRMLDVEYIAQMPAPALQAPYQDYDVLRPDLKGYAALTWGLNIIKGDGRKFNSFHKITRGEAAAVLVRTLRAAG